MKQYTVIGYFETSGNKFSHHVEAVDEWEAFTACGKVLEADEDGEGGGVFVAAIEGHHIAHAPCESGATADVSDYLGET